MKNKVILVAGLLTSLAGASIAISQNLNINQFKLFADGSSTNAEYTIATWEFDGWCKNASIDGYYEQGRVFMFHSTSNGAGKKVRSDVKLAVILNQMTDQDDIEGDMDFTLVNGMPSLVCNDHLYYVEDEHNNPVWPANYMAIYTVHIMIGDFTFEGNEESGILYENEEYGNFTLKSFLINATLTYAEPDDDPAGNWHRIDYTYPRSFTQTQTEIGDYEGDSSQPHVGFKVDGIMVTYGCSY